MTAPKKAFSRAARPENPDIAIYCDIDGVLTDFDGHARAQGKLLPDGSNNWDAMDYDWWRTMPAYAGAQDFYRALHRIAPTKLLTAPTLSTGCFAGKAVWAESFLPERGKFLLKDLIICNADSKEAFARPKSILIDDRAKNVDAWVRAGGIGILHAGDYAQTLAQVRAAVAAIRADAAPEAPKPDVPPRAAPPNCG
jgi:hypothetical protein